MLLTKKYATRLSLGLYKTLSSAQHHLTPIHNKVNQDYLC